MSEYNELDIKQVRSSLTLAQLQALLDSVYSRYTTLTNPYMPYVDSTGKLKDTTVKYQTSTDAVQINNLEVITSITVGGGGSQSVVYNDFSGNTVFNDATGFTYDGVDLLNVPSIQLTNGQQIYSLDFGTYTPTLTGVTNIQATTTYQCQYMRVGNVVTVSGLIDIDATVVGNTVLGISLPIASNFANNYECAGTICASTVASQCGRITADTTNDRANVTIQTVSLANESHAFTFTYTVI